MNPDLDAVRAIAGKMRSGGFHVGDTADTLEALAAEVEALRAAANEAQEEVSDLRTEMEARAANYEYGLARARATIAALEARVEALTGALAPFSAWAVFLPENAPDDRRVTAHGARVTYGDLRRARAALSQKDTPDA